MLTCFLLKRLYQVNLLEEVQRLIIPTPAILSIATGRNYNGDSEPYLDSDYWLVENGVTAAHAYVTSTHRTVRSDRSLPLTDRADLYHSALWLSRGVFPLSAKVSPFSEAFPSRNPCALNINDSSRPRSHRQSASQI